jgi:hypothetical protein
MLETPNCWIRKCKHFIGVKQDDENEETERVVCEAFPDGTPDEIAYGDNDHTKVFPGQKNKIIYEKRE